MTSNLIHSHKIREGEQLFLSVIQTPNKNDELYVLLTAALKVASLNIIKQNSCVLILNRPFHLYVSIMLKKSYFYNKS